MRASPRLLVAQPCRGASRATGLAVSRRAPARRHHGPRYGRPRHPHGVFATSADADNFLYWPPAGFRQALQAQLMPHTGGRRQTCCVLAAASRRDSLRGCSQQVLAGLILRYAARRREPAQRAARNPPTKVSPRPMVVGAATSRSLLGMHRTASPSRSLIRAAKIVPPGWRGPWRIALRSATVKSSPWRVAGARQIDSPLERVSRTRGLAGRGPGTSTSCGPPPWERWRIAGTPRAPPPRRPRRAGRPAAPDRTATRPRSGCAHRPGPGTPR